MKRFWFMALAFAMAFAGCDTGNSGGVTEVHIQAWIHWAEYVDGALVRRATPTTGTLTVTFFKLGYAFSVQAEEALAAHASAIVATLEPRTTTYGGNRSFEIGEMEPFGSEGDNTVNFIFEVTRSAPPDDAFHFSDLLCWHNAGNGFYGSASSGV